MSGIEDPFEADYSSLTDGERHWLDELEYRDWLFCPVDDLIGMTAKAPRPEWGAWLTAFVKARQTVALKLLKPNGFSV